MEEKDIQVGKIIDALRCLSNLSEAQKNVIQNALNSDAYDFTLCNKVAKKLNQIEAKSSPAEEWNSHRVLDFLSILEFLYKNLSEFGTNGEDFRESLREFFVFNDFPTDGIDALSSEELGSLEEVLFSDLASEDLDINLINGVVDTRVSISLKTIFTADGTLSYFVPIATLKITAQDMNNNFAGTCFQLTKSDIDDLITSLAETQRRIVRLEREPSEDVENVNS